MFLYTQLIVAYGQSKLLYSFLSSLKRRLLKTNNKFFCDKTIIFSFMNLLTEKQSRESHHVPWIYQCLSLVRKSFCKDSDVENYLSWPKCTTVRQVQISRSINTWIYREVSGSTDARIKEKPRRRGNVLVKLKITMNEMLTLVVCLCGVDFLHPWILLWFLPSLFVLIQIIPTKVGTSLVLGNTDPLSLTIWKLFYYIDHRLN